MVRIRALQVRLTRDQHERLKNNAEQKGFSSLASYVRYVTLHQDLFLEDKVNKIYQYLLGEYPSISTSEGKKARQIRRRSV